MEKLVRDEVSVITTIADAQKCRRAPEQSKDPATARLKAQQMKVAAMLAAHAEEKRLFRERLKNDPKVVLFPVDRRKRTPEEVRRLRLGMSRESFYDVAPGRDD